METLRIGQKVWHMRPKPNELGRTYTVDSISDNNVLCVFRGRKKLIPLNELIPAEK